MPEMSRRDLAVTGGVALVIIADLAVLSYRRALATESA
jgi:hypothetical protein